MIARDTECENAQRCVNVDKLVNEVITSNVQALMVVGTDQEVKFDQETSITDVKNTLTSELHSVGRSSNVSKESPMSESTANVLIEKSVRDAEHLLNGISKDCEGCRVAASGDEVSRPHGKECRERIEVAVMCDEAGQQRLCTAKERLASAASATRAGVAQEGQASLARVEVAQESRDEEMNEARVTNDAENVKHQIGESRDDSTEVSDRMEDKPRIDESRDDSTEVTSRMEDSNTPVGGPLVSAEVSSRSEGVLPSRK